MKLYVKKKAGLFNHGDVFIAEVDIFFSYLKEKSRWALQKRINDSGLKIGDLLLCCLKTHAWLSPLLLSSVKKANKMAEKWTIRKLTF